MPGATELILLSLIAVVFLLPGIPGYTIAKRRGLDRRGLAFVPYFGIWIVLFRSVGRTGWWLAALLGLLLLLPFVGLPVVSIWTGVEVPTTHDRSRWWIAPLVVP